MEDFEREARNHLLKWRILVGGAVTAGVLALVLPCAGIAWQVVKADRQRAAADAQWHQTATPEQVAAVETALAGLDDDALERRNQAWHETLETTPDLESMGGDRCPVHLPVAKSMEAGGNGGWNNSRKKDWSVVALPGTQAFPFYLSTSGELPAEAPRMTLARKRAADLREHVRGEARAEDFPRYVQEAEDLSGAFWTWDVVVFPTYYERPSASFSGTEFTPGHAEGRVVIYDYRREVVVCVGTFAADSTSAEVRYQSQMLHERSTLQARLDMEFDAELQRAIARGQLYAVADREP